MSPLVLCCVPTGEPAVTELSSTAFLTCSRGVKEAFEEFSIDSILTVAAAVDSLSPARPDGPADGLGLD